MYILFSYIFFFFKLFNHFFLVIFIFLLFFFNETATTEIYTLSLHERSSDLARRLLDEEIPYPARHERRLRVHAKQDRKSTRLNSSHFGISYAVFCLKKKKTNRARRRRTTTQAKEPARHHHQKAR